jgi:tetratricopeptide (TPR) repeat protein
MPESAHSCFTTDYRIYSSFPRSWRFARNLRLLSLLACFVMGIPLITPLNSQINSQKSEGTDSCNARAALQSADGLLKLHRSQQALALLGTLRKCSGLSPVERFNIGWFYGRAHDFKTALAIFDQVGANVPDPPTHAYAVALGQFELANYQGAIVTLENLRAQGALNADCSNLLAVSYSKLGQYQDAYPLLLVQLHQNPRELFAYLNLITLLVDCGKFPEAAKVAGQAVAAFPHDSEVWVVRGAAYTLLGDMDKAHQDFAEAVRIAPKKPDPRFFLAITDYRQANYALAATELRTAMRSGVVDSDLEYLLAECDLKLDPTKPSEAIAELDRAIRLNEKSVPARSLRGKLLLEQRRVREAVIDLEAAHRTDPTARSATYSLARAYFQLGRQGEAQTLFQDLNRQSIDAVDDLSDQRMKEVLSGQRIE